MLWKIYFYAYLVVASFSLLINLSGIKLWNITDWIDLFSNSFNIYMLYIYIFRHKELTLSTWITTLILTFSSLILATLTSLNHYPSILPTILLSHTATDPRELITSIAFTIPIMIALWKTMPKPKKAAPLLKKTNKNKAKKKS